MSRDAFARALAWTLVRLRWPIVLAWLAAAIAAVVYLPSLEETGDETSLVGLVPQDAEALAAGERSAELFDIPVITHTAVVQRDPDGLSRAAVARVARRADRIMDREDPELREISGALPIVNARGLVPGSRETGTTAITYLFFDPAETDLDDQDELARRYADKYVHFRDDALVGVTGAVPARLEEWRQIEAGLPWVTAATIAVIALILGIHFRSPVAPLVTLVAAGAAYLVSLRTAALVGRELDVSIPRDAEPVLVVLLLGVVTDYAVFFLHGFRERLAAGEDRSRPPRTPRPSTCRSSRPQGSSSSAARSRSSPGSSSSSAPSGPGWRSRWRSACSSRSRSCRRRWRSSGRASSGRRVRATSSRRANGPAGLRCSRRAVRSRSWSCSCRWPGSWSPRAACSRPISDQPDPWAAGGRRAEAGRAGRGHGVRAGNPLADGRPRGGNRSSARPPGPHPARARAGGGAGRRRRDRTREPARP